MRFQLAILASAVLTSASSAALVTYDGGSPNRPTAVSDLIVNGTTYNVTFTFNNNGETNPLRVGALPDSDIPEARTALLNLLNTQGIDSRVTNLLFQPNVDPSPPPAGQFRIEGSLTDRTPGPNEWTEFMPGLNGSAPGNDGDFSGFAQFTVVPEPGGFLLLGLLSAAVAVRHVIRSLRQ